MTAQVKREKVLIQDIAARERYALNGGPFGSKLVSSMYVDKGVPVIRGTNLPFDRKFSFDRFVFVSKEKASELRANLARPGDLIFTQRGTLGQIGIIPISSPYQEFVISQSQMKLSVNQSKVDALYLYYYFRQPAIVDKIEALALRAGVPHINLQILREFPVELPDIDTQQRITSILSSYDDLIENNTRRIEILEELTRRIYEEWFVHFRAPDFEDLPLVDSSLGPIPQGWKIEVATKAFEIEYGKTLPKTMMNGSGTYPVYGAGGIIGRYDSKNVREATTLITSRGAGSGTVFRTIEAAFVTNNSFIVTRSSATKGWSQVMIQLALSRAPIKNAVGGAAQPQLTLDGLGSVPILLPPDALADRFSDIAGSTGKLAINLELQNRNLRVQRDLLLPKLISGEIDLSEAEELLEAAE